MMPSVALHHLFTKVVILIAVALILVVLSAAAFAVPPSSVASFNEVPRAIVDDGEENIEWMMDDWMLRFGGVARLYANKGNESPNDILHRLHHSTVAIIGLGGVGSWAAEALCRSGVGNLILVDLDDICVSNTNRQLHALTSTVGQMKIDEMKRRLLDINPRCNVTLM